MELKYIIALISYKFNKKLYIMSPEVTEYIKNIIFLILNCFETLEIQNPNRVIADLVEYLTIFAPDVNNL